MLAAIEAITKEPEVGDTYTGKVVKTTQFGAFVELKKGTDGLLHVSNVEASLRFYVDQLGFTVAWRVEDEGRVFVAEVDRGSSALILCDQWPEKVGRGAGG